MVLELRLQLQILPGQQGLAHFQKGLPLPHLGQNVEVDAEQVDTNVDGRLDAGPKGKLRAVCGQLGIGRWGGQDFEQEGVETTGDDAQVEWEWDDRVHKQDYLKKNYFDFFGFLKKNFT